MHENDGNGNRLTAHRGLSAILRSAGFHIHFQIEMDTNEGSLLYGSAYIRARFGIVVACLTCRRMDTANRRVMPYCAVGRSRSLNDLSAMENMSVCASKVRGESRDRVSPVKHLDMIIQKPIAISE